MQFQDKVVLVTGGSSGLGLAIAQELARQEATVVITGRRQEQLTEALSQLGERASAVVADVSVIADLAVLFDEIKARHGRIDVLVANAGMGEIAPLGSITEAYLTAYSAPT
jgi:NAD(P)-dependent dehydrogenase (short-subunit alcohol dehydrogenase family)